MRRATALLFSAFCVNAAFGQAQAPKAPAKSLFLIKAPDEQWCAYTSKSDAEADVKRLTGLAFVEVAYAQDRISTVDSEEWGLSGDWDVDDKYALDNNQRFLTLLRTTDNFSLGITQERLYRFQNGKAIRVRSASKGLHTGNPKQDLSDNDLPDVSVIANLQSFPFWPLIRDKRQEILSKGKACITVKRPSPTPPAPPVPVKAWSLYTDRFGWTIEYPSTWKTESSCPVGCPAPGEAVGFLNPATNGYVQVSSFTNQLGGRSVEARLQELKTRNVNPQISEIPVTVDGHPALTMRYEQPETQMETTYLVTDSAFFEIYFSSTHWKIEQMTDYPAYRHMLSSFKFPK